MAAYVDALGRAVEVSRPPRRIVSLVPSITEALFAFGLGDAVVGVTRFCVEPRGAAADKTRVGGTKTADVDRIIGLQPDLVIANVEENRREDVERLEKAGLRVFMTYPRTIAQAIGEMRTLARMTASQEAARPYLDDAEQALERALAAKRRRGTVSVFCPIWRNPWMTVGPDTYMHDFITACGGANVFADSAERYPRVTLQEAAKRQPEVILLPNEPYRFRERHAEELRRSMEVPAVRNERIYLLDGKYLCWYGPRIAESLRFVQKLLWSGV